jgi:hypothetical protein
MAWGKAGTPTDLETTDVVLDDFAWKTLGKKEPPQLPT